MRIVRTVHDLQEKLDVDRRRGRQIGLVPTMGSLHAGHARLIEIAERENDVVVASVFVNPIQFGEGEDLDRYPRDLVSDASIASAAGADVMFTPSVAEMYPAGFDTVVEVQGLGRILEGAVRPGHFRGVATVVTKLLNIVRPQRAYFGEKDFQQLAVIRRFVADLCIPVAIVGVPTVRDESGLALSSRNVYLDDRARAAALCLSHALAQAEQWILAGERDPSVLERDLMERIEEEPMARPRMVAVRNAETLQELPVGLAARIVVLLVVRVGNAELTDERVIEVRPDETRLASSA